MVLEPYDDLFTQMEREMERITQDAFQRFDHTLTRIRPWQPRVDVCETADAVVVIVELAGLNPETISRQVEVTLSPDDRSLLISGRREEATDQEDRVRCHQLEIYFGEFARVVPLPTDISIQRGRIAAVYRNGLLLVSLPKVASPARRRSVAAR